MQKTLIHSVGILALMILLQNDSYAGPGQMRVGDNSKNIVIFTSGADTDIMSSTALHLNYGNNQLVYFGQGGTSDFSVSGNVRVGNGSKYIDISQLEERLAKLERRLNKLQQVLGHKAR